MNTPYTRLELSYIVPVYFNGRDSRVLDELIRIYSTYAPDVLARIQFVFVDDGSPLPVKLPPNCPLNYQLLRITKDIPWNQPGARNLGVTVARTTKLILTDLDHIFPEALFRKMLAAGQPRGLYTFRRELGGVKYRHHPNTFYCSKATFFKSMGVDEEFSGHYGSEDMFFRALQERLGTKIRHFTRWHRISLLDLKDQPESYHSLERNTSVNGQLLQQKLQLLKGPNPLQAHSRLFLNFPWERVEERIHP